MKKIFALIAFIVLLIVILGFIGIGIPIGNEIVSEVVLGERKAQEGQVSEQILQLEGLQNYFFLISLDGGGKKHQSFFKFYLKKGENRIHLSHIPFTPREYDVLRPVLPVQESTKWIAARLSRVERNDVDVELIIFDEKRIYRTLVVKECMRTSTSTERWTDLFNYGMAFKDGNTKIVFNTNKGECLFNVINNTFEKI
jgi:hypothetical protein